MHNVQALLMVLAVAAALGLADAAQPEAPNTTRMIRLT